MLIQIKLNLINSKGQISSVWGVGIEKLSVWGRGPLFSSIFDNSRKSNGQAF